MKFEKFLKNTGAYGFVHEEVNGTKWLSCAGVTMRVPAGIKTLLGQLSTNVTPEMQTIINADLDDELTLKDAIVLTPNGSARDIVRVFKTDLDDSIGILNADYGLLDKADTLHYLELETEKGTDKYMLVSDKTGEIQGYIKGLTEK